ncbi:MAG: site-specific DNA-methyltransferase [Terracidiphilus sp.]|jgi:adenine-specific DNA-methyltransferase
MKRLTAEDAETKTPDVVAENIEQLKTIFPEAFTEEKVDFEVLKQLLGGMVEEREEKYGLNWYGKRRARQLALTPSNGTLRPCPEESVEWDTTRNLMIEGDNLEVLKLLQKSYSGKVKLIYIDPPYNTGNDFIYPDDFKDSIKNYLLITGQVDGAGNKIASNTEASGRFHTDWLNMIFPRLKLARNLLTEDGIIFISIDDGEVDNLRKVCGEVFGEENFITTVLWQKVYSPKNSARHFSDDHDYVVVYARNSEIWRPSLLPRSDEANARYENIDNDPRGSWKPSDLTARNYYSKGLYEITSPSGKKFTSGVGRYWRQSIEGFHELEQDNRIWWGPQGDAMPSQKRFLTEVQQGMVPQTMWFYKDVGHTQEAKKELLKYVAFKHNENVLNSVKPPRLIQRMLQIGTSPDAGDLVLDFFGGSAATAHAVMLQNESDGGNRRFILVQLPEPLPTPEPQMSTIFEMGMQRVRSVGKEMREERQKLLSAPDTETDLGFRVFKLASSNIRAWEPNRDDLPTTLHDSIEHLKTDRTEQDILFELLLKLGLDLTIPIEQKSIAGKAVHNIGAGTLLVCLAEQIAAAEVEPLALGIAAWHKALAPAGETTVVFRDSAFADDVAKTNLTAILQQHGLENIRSL